MLVVTDPRVPTLPVTSSSRRTRSVTALGDMATALEADGGPGFVLLDSRFTASWDQGHIPGAVHLPTALIAEQAPGSWTRPSRWSRTAGGPAATGRPGPREHSPNSATR